MILQLDDNLREYTIAQLISSDREGRREVYQALSEGFITDVWANIIVYADLSDEQNARLFAREKALREQSSTRALPTLRDYGTIESQGHNIGYIITKEISADPLQEMMADGPLSTATSDTLCVDLIKALVDIYRNTGGALHFGLDPYSLKAEIANGYPRIFLTALHLLSADMQHNADMPILPERADYRAPETWQGQPFDERAFQFELALVINYLYSGQHPWGLDEHADPEFARQVMADTAPEICLPALQLALGRALDIDPQKRWGSIDQMLQCLAEDMKLDLDVSFSPQAKHADAEANTPKGAPGGQIAVDYRDLTEVRDLYHPADLHRTVNIDGIAGRKAIKARLQHDFVDMVRNADLAGDFGLRVPHLLLTGPFGAGKSYIARCLAGELGLQCVTVSSELIGQATAANQYLVHAAFDKAMEESADTGGTLLLLDDIDRLYPETAPAYAVMDLANCLRDCLGRGVYVIATSTDAACIHHGLRADGLFDTETEICQPDAETRLALLQQMIESRPHASDIAYGALAKMTEGLSARDISMIVDESARMAFHQTLMSRSATTTDITTAMLESALQKAKGR